MIEESRVNRKHLGKSDAVIFMKSSSKWIFFGRAEIFEQWCILKKKATACIRSISWHGMGRFFLMEDILLCSNNREFLDWWKIHQPLPPKETIIMMSDIQTHYWQLGTALPKMPKELALKKKTLKTVQFPRNPNKYEITFDDWMQRWTQNAIQASWSCFAGRENIQFELKIFAHKTFIQVFSQALHKNPPDFPAVRKKQFKIAHFKISLISSWRNFPVLL